MSLTQNDIISHANHVVTALKEVNNQQMHQQCRNGKYSVFRTHLLEFCEQFIAKSKTTNHFIPTCEYFQVFY